MDVWSMENGCPGSLPERPLVFVKSAEMNQCLVSWSRRIYRSWQPPDQIAYSNLSLSVYLPDCTKVIIDSDKKKLYTDGVVRRKVLSRHGNRQCLHYRICTYYSYQENAMFTEHAQIWESVVVSNQSNFIPLIFTYIHITSRNDQ